jgi:hypothetical protein
MLCIDLAANVAHDLDGRAGGANPPLTVQMIAMG